jgi:hypothetical protein
MFAGMLGFIYGISLKTIGDNLYLILSLYSRIIVHLSCYSINWSNTRSYYTTIGILNFLSNLLGYLVTDYHSIVQMFHCH